PDGLRVVSDPLHPPRMPIDARNSGTTLRFLARVAALLDGSTTLSGDASLQKRPMGPLLEALTSLGARGSSVSGDGRPPIEVEGVLRGGRVSLSGSISSQFLSSLLIACPLAAYPSEIRVLTGQTVDVSNAPDLFPILAVLAPQANGETRFVNGDHLRVKESDRIASTVAMLRALGARAEPTPDGCVVHGPASLHGAFIDARADHRVLMAAAIAGLAADDSVDISDPWCFRVSYPSFLDDMRALGALHAVVE